MIPGNGRGSTLFAVQTVTAAGSTQADAWLLPLKGPIFFLANGNDLKGLRLPPAAKGKMCVIKNTGTGGLQGGLKVYPATGDSINALSANEALVMATASSAMFYAVSSTVWHTVPTVPS